MEVHILSAEPQVGDFKTYVRSLVERFQPLRLFSFSRIKILSEATGCFQQQHSRQCHYCLLMETESSAQIDHQVQDFSNSYYQQGSILILCHSQQAISEAIRANNRFFITVYNYGELLFAHDGFTCFDPEVKFIPTQAAGKAQKQLNHRLPLAEGFLRGAYECLAKLDFRVAVFMLHQAVEQCCVLLIYIHLGYRFEVHNILRLLRLCSSFSDQPIKTFLTGSAEDQRLFDVLLKSYSGSRYGSGFTVSGQDTQALYERVSSFVELVKEMCNSKIEQLDRESILYRELKGESEVTNG